jgi:hypothetical protein
MKKIVFFFLCLLWASVAEAQTSSSNTKKIIEKHHGKDLQDMGAQLGFLVQDSTNEYFRVRLYKKEKTSGTETDVYFYDWTFWTLGAAVVLGAHFEIAKDKEGGRRDVLHSLRFFDAYGKDVTDYVWSKESQKVYNESLKEVSFAQNYIFYAELPRISTDTINLFIVPKNDLWNSKKQIMDGTASPSSKMQFGSLRIEKEQNTFGRKIIFQH